MQSECITNFIRFLEVLEAMTQFVQFVRFDQNCKVEKVGRLGVRKMTFEKKVATVIVGSFFKAPTKITNCLLIDAERKI